MSTGQGKPPSMLILMDKKMPAFEIARFDVVICSHGFLHIRSRDWHTARQHFHLSHLRGVLLYVWCAKEASSYSLVFGIL